MCDYTMMDKIRNKVIKDIIKVTPIEDKMRETRLEWFGYMKRMSVDAPVRRYERINIPEGRRGRGRPKKSLDGVIREDLTVVELTEDIVQARRLLRDIIKVLD